MYTPIRHNIKVQKGLAEEVFSIRQVILKYFVRFWIYGADTILILTIRKGHNSAKMVYGVTVFVFCTLPNHSLHLFQVS